MRREKFSWVALAAAAAMIPAFATPAQVVTTGSWTNMVAPDNSGAPFWDNASLDGDKCNVGFFLLYTAGSGFGSCANEKPTAALVDANAGRLGVGVTGAPNGSYLSHDAFAFKAGRYRIEFLANIAGYGPAAVPPQELWVFADTGAGAYKLQRIYAVGTYPGSLTTVFDLNVTQDWFLGALHASGDWDYSREMMPDHGWSLFSSRSATTSAPGAADDIMWAGFGDVQGGDQDYNDLIVQIQSVPEPASVVLIGIGLVGLAAVSKRRRGPTSAARRPAGTA